MSEHKNVTDVALDLQVDGVAYHAQPGDVVSVPDEFDYQLESQPAWELVSKKSAPVASTPEPVAASEGDN